jgi:hypothetical protein
MTSKSKLAISAVLFSAIASPSFAFAQLGVGADPVSDGRFAPVAMHAQTGAYASAIATKRAPAQTWTTEMQINDRLAQGHN